MTGESRKFRMYVDEVGNADLGSSDDPNHRFLSLTGVIVELEHVRATLHPEMEAIKERFFGSHPDEPVIPYRKETVNRLPPFGALQDAATRTAFDEALLAALSGWDYTVVTVCIDKQRHRDMYTTWRHDPYHYCMEVLLERYVLFLEEIGPLGDVAAESRGGKEDRRLKDSFARHVARGTDYVEAGGIQSRLTSTRLKVKPKAINVSGLQLADLLAHPSRNEILYQQKLRTAPLPEFGMRVAEMLESEYRRTGTKVWGCGKKLLP